MGVHENRSKSDSRRLMPPRAFGASTCYRLKTDRGPGSLNIAAANPGLLRHCCGRAATPSSSSATYPRAECRLENEHRDELAIFPLSISGPLPSFFERERKREFSHARVVSLSEKLEEMIFTRFPACFRSRCCSGLVFAVQRMDQLVSGLHAENRPFSIGIDSERCRNQMSDSADNLYFL
jgi:hypothetical protein